MAASASFAISPALPSRNSCSSVSAARIFKAAEALRTSITDSPFLMPSVSLPSAWAIERRRRHVARHFENGP